MLRDYAQTENWRLLDHALEQFIDLPARLSLVGFIELSPDSFLWQIFDGVTHYYLYAEDYVPSLDHVKQQICDFYQKDIDLTFVKAKVPLAFEDSTPNKTATVYQPPEDEYEFAKYSSQSGYDFVFLLTA